VQPVRLAPVRGHLANRVRPAQAVSALASLALRVRRHRASRVQRALVSPVASLARLVPQARNRLVSRVQPVPRAPVRGHPANRVRPALVEWALASLARRALRVRSHPGSRVPPELVEWVLVLAAGSNPPRRERGEQAPTQVQAPVPVGAQRAQPVDKPGPRREQEQEQTGPILSAAE
jgi:hypothetical protein